VSADDGAVKWSFALPDTTVRYSAPAVEGNLVVAGASDGYLRAFDAETGDVRWTFYNDAALASTPLITPNTIYVGSMGRQLFAVDRATGAVKWKQELRGRVKSAMAARGEYLVVLSEPRFVYLFKSSPATNDVLSP
jgi:outer membrane protein assembly factor BamB